MDPVVQVIGALMILVAYAAAQTGRWSTDAARRVGDRDGGESAQAASARSSRWYALTHLRIALSETPYLRPTAE